MSNTLIRTPQELYKVYASLEKYNGFLAFDTETYGPTTDWVKKKTDRIVWDYTAKMADFSFSFRGESYCIPIHNKDIQFDADVAKRFLRAFFKLPNRFWAHNIDYDSRVIANFVGEYLWPERMGDTMILCWILGRGVRTWRNGKEVFLHGLKDLVKHHFMHEMSNYKDTIAPFKALTAGPDDIELDHILSEKMREIIANRKQLSLLNEPPTKRELRSYEAFKKKQVALRKYRDAQMNEIPAEAVLDYACEDAFWALQLATRFWPELQRMNYTAQWDNLEMPILRIIRDMHDTGLIVNEKKVAEIKDICQPIMEPLAAEFKELTGADITSSQQCGYVFYGAYQKFKIAASEEGTKVEPGRLVYQGGIFPIEDAPMTKGGVPAVNYDALMWAQHVTKDDPFAQKLIQMKLRYAEVAKLATTYTDSVTAQIPYSPDKRVRPRYNQTGTNTGRFSSSNPFNAQNFPTKSDSLPDIREAFVPPDGYVYASMDLSQIEIVLMAHFSGDEKLRDIILNGKSMHDVTAEALGIERKHAKAVNFLKNYGGGPRKLAQSLNVPLIEQVDKDGRVTKVAPQWVKNYCEGYDKLYAGVTAYRETMSDVAARYGYVETILGRRRNMPDIRALKEEVKRLEERCRKGFTLRKHKPEKFNEEAERLLNELINKRKEVWLKLSSMERIASNTPIQGSAADLIKLAMVAIYNNWKERNVPNKIVMQIHDELVFYLKRETAEKELDIIRDIMVNVIKISLPINASGGIGETWGECK